MTKRTGGCLCGAVKYTVSSDPVAARICWCRDCQKNSANGTANIMVPTESIEFSGTLSEYHYVADSGNPMLRRFCSRCGTQVFGNSMARPQFTVIRVGTLDDPSSVRPTINIWTSSAPGWACMDSTLETSDKQPAPPQQPSR